MNESNEFFHSKNYVNLQTFLLSLVNLQHKKRCLLIKTNFISVITTRALARSSFSKNSIARFALVFFFPPSCCCYASSGYMILRILQWKQPAKGRGASSFFLNYRSFPVTSRSLSIRMKRNLFGDARNCETKYGVIV